MNLLRSLSLGTRVSRSLFSPSTRLVHLEAKPEQLPIWYQPQNETTEVKRRRLLYQSRKRGMLENCLLLSHFASTYLPTLNEQDLDLYDKLINTPSNDWDLYHMAIGKIETPAEYQHHVMDLLKRYVKNEQKQIRVRQPDLDST